MLEIQNNCQHQSHLGEGRAVVAVTLAAAVAVPN